MKINGEIEDLKIKKCLKKKKKKRKNNQKKKKNDCKSSKGITGPFSGAMSCVGSLPRQFPLFNFLCLLVSSVSDFHLDIGRAVVDTLGSLFSRAVGREETEATWWRKRRVQRRGEWSSQ